MKKYTLSDIDGLIFNKSEKFRKKLNDKVNAIYQIDGYLSLNDDDEDSDIDYDDDEEFDEDESRMDHNRKTDINDEINLNPQQMEIYVTYKDYLCNASDTSKKPPSFVLMTGKAGSGKSEVIKAIVKIGGYYNNIPLCTAFNNLNASDLNGPTITILLGGISQGNSFNEIKHSLATPCYE